MNIKEIKDIKARLEIAEIDGFGLDQFGDMQDLIKYIEKRREAINIVVAVVVCGNRLLNCYEHCPLYNPKLANCCNDWTDEQAYEAVRLLKGE